MFVSPLLKVTLSPAIVNVGEAGYSSLLPASCTGHLPLDRSMYSWWRMQGPRSTERTAQDERDAEGDPRGRNRLRFFSCPQAVTSGYNFDAFRRGHPPRGNLMVRVPYWTSRTRCSRSLLYTGFPIVDRDAVGLVELGRSRRSSVARIACGPGSHDSLMTPLVLTLRTTLFTVSAM